MSINRDSKKLHTAIGKTIASLRKVSEELGEHAVSTLWHLGQHRNPSVLNFLYANLNKNMQAGFKRWIVKVSSEALTSAGFNDVSLSSLPFRMTKDTFEVVKSEKDSASVRKTDAIAAYLVANEETVGFGNFMDIDTDKEKDPFSVLSIMKTLKSLVSKTDKSDLEDTVKLALAEMVKGFEVKVRPEIDIADEAARVTLYKGGRPGVVAHELPAHIERPAMVN